MKAGLVFLLVSTVVTISQAQQWPTFRADSARSGIAGESIDCSRLELFWKWQSDLPPDPAWDGPARWDAYNRLRDLPAMRQYDACFHPVSDGQKVYVASSSQDTLTALDLEDGKFVWSFVAGGPIRLAPSLSNGKIYFGCDNGCAYCLDSQSGQLVWRFSPSRHIQSEQRLVINNDRLISFYPIRTGVTIRDGLAYFAASFLPWRKSYIRAVDAETGELDNSKDTFVEKHENATLEGSLLIADDHLIVPQGRVAPLLFDRVTGKSLGSLPGGGGVAVVITDSGEVVRAEGGRPAREGQVGVFKGKERVASFPRGRAIVVDSDRYYVIAGQKLLAADKSNNQLVWQRSVNDPLELIKVGDDLIVGGQDHTTAVDSRTGDVTWSASVIGRVFGLAFANRRLIASTDTGRLYTFAATSDKPWEDKAPSAGATNWKSPDVPHAETRDVLHRWVFHRSAMKVGGNQPVTNENLSGVVVKDQAGRADIKLQGTTTAVKIGESKNIEGIALSKNFFSISDDVSDRLPVDAISAEAWVRVDHPLTWGGIVGCIQDDGSTEHGWLLGFRDDKFSFAVAGTKSGLTYLSSPNSFQPKSWNHVVGTYDGREMKLYVNGSLAATGTDESGPISYANKRIFTVGSYKDENEHYPLVGAVNEVCVYSAALDARQVNEMYRAKANEFPTPEQTGTTAEKTEFVSWGPIANYIRPGSVEIRYGTQSKCETAVDLISPSEVKRFIDKTKTDEHRIVIDALPHRRQLKYQILQRDSDNAEKTGLYALDTHFDWSQSISVADDPWTLDIIERSPNPRGLAIVVGRELADAAKRLALGSQFSVVLIVDNDQQASEVRQSWLDPLQRDDAGVHYGKQLSVMPVSLEQLPGAFAAVVVSKSRGDQIRRIVRPAGGIIHDGQKVVWTRSPVTGSGVWSHMYGDTDNSAFGGETLSHTTTREDLLTQWIGRPGPRYQTDRQNRKPSPLAVDGRMYLQGQQRMIALDSFSGSVLWSIESPTVMRWNVPHDCSNWCADKLGVYVAAEREAWLLSGRTGQIEKRFKMPECKSSRADLRWGYIGRYQDYLIGSSVSTPAIYTDWWGSKNWFDSTTGPDTHVVAGDQLFVLDKSTGKTIWQYTGLLLHPTIMVLNDRVYFVEDRSPAHTDGQIRRIALSKDQQHVLVCLDVKSGQRIWERPIPGFAGHVSSFYLAGGGAPEVNRTLVLVASESTKQKFSVQSFDPQNGTPGWKRMVDWEANHHGKHISRPAIQGELVYLRPEVLNIKTGETITRGFPSGHGCSSYSLSTGGLFSRLGETTWWDVRNDKVHRFERIRTDCWLSVVPAQGMVLSAEGGGGCSCGSWLETSLGFLPRSVDEYLPDEK